MWEASPRDYRLIEVEGARPQFDYMRRLEVRHSGTFTVGIWTRTSFYSGTFTVGILNHLWHIYELSLVQF